MTRARENADGARLDAPLDSPTFTGNFTSVGIDDNADATAITIDSDEKVGIGETSPAYKFHLKTSDGGTQPAWDTNNSGARNLGLFETGENEGAVTIFSPNTGVALYYAFADPESRIGGAIRYNHSVNNMSFYTNATERVDIDSNGKFRVGGDSGNFFAADTNGVVYAKDTYERAITGTKKPVQVQDNGLFGYDGSSRRFKINIADIDDADIDLLKNLKCRKFNNRVQTPLNDDGTGGEFTDEAHTALRVGLIAEEVKESCEAGSLTNRNYYQEDDKGIPDYVSYEEFITPLIKGYQNLLVENTELKTKLDALETRLTTLENA